MSAQALAVRERPILFSGAMVRAILDGRKSQTRRAVTPQPVDVDEDGPYRQRIAKAGAMAFADRVHIRCPYGQPGDRLWVRETFACVGGAVVRDGAPDGYELSFAFAAGPEDSSRRVRTSADQYNRYIRRPLRWRPSIHMPRFASRILLEITDIRVERAAEISEADAKAEGLAEITKDGTTFKYGIPDRDGLPGTDNDGWPWDQWECSPRVAFRRLWDSINAARGYGWDANPWVWAISFQRVTP